MSNYEFNMNSLKNRYPQLHDMIKKLKSDNSIFTVPSADGRHTCYIKPKGEKLFIHDERHPLKEANAFIETTMPADNDQTKILVLLGLGMGHYLEALLMKYTDIKFCIVFERDPQMFKKFIETTSLRSVSPDKKGMVSIFDNPRVDFVVGTQVDDIYFRMFDQINTLGERAFSSMHFVEHPILVRFNKDYYKPAAQEINRVCRDIRAAYGNDPEDSWSGVDNMLLNLNTIVSNPGIDSTFNKFQNRPAVIVATGPSLNKNIHLLPQIKNRALIFAADASLNTLLNYSTPIVPDMVCSLERNLSTCNHFSQIKDKDSMKDIWLAACPVVKPEVYKEWHGKNAVIFRDFAHFRWLGFEKGILSTGKSVTNMAFQIAIEMGCNPIILVGQDLAFAKDGNSHATGADHAREGMKNSELIKQTATVMGNDGTQLKSLDTWVGMLKRFELDIHRWKGTCINATEGGARIKGAKVMTLNEVDKNILSQPFYPGKVLNGLLKIPTTAQKTCDLERADINIKDGVEYLKSSLKELDDVLKTMDTAMGLVAHNTVTDNEIKTIMEYAEGVKDKVLQHPLCYTSAMHILQSWCMGRENIFRTVPFYYKDKEAKVEKMIRVFDLFYGLRILYNSIINGIKANYKWKK